MRISQWSHFLSLPVALRVACVEAASPNPRDSHIYDSTLAGDQKVFSSLCPDYTDYARHKQYVPLLVSFPNQLHSTNIPPANHSVKALYIYHTSDPTPSVANSPLQLPRK